MVTLWWPLWMSNRMHICSQSSRTMSKWQVSHRGPTYSSPIRKARASTQPWLIFSIRLKIFKSSSMRKWRKTLKWIVAMQPSPNSMEARWIPWIRISVVTKSRKKAQIVRIRITHSSQMNRRTWERCGISITLLEAVLMQTLPCNRVARRWSHGTSMGAQKWIRRQQPKALNTWLKSARIRTFKAKRNWHQRPEWLTDFKSNKRTKI